MAPADRIALPGIGSIQHIVLAMAAEQQLGMPRILDRNLVPLDHPQGEQALLSGMVAFHFTGAPYQDREVQAGARRILNSFEVLGGPHTFNVAVAPRTFVEQRPDAYCAVTDALADAVAILARFDGPGIRWTIEPHRLVLFASFMRRAGFIAREPRDWRELTWPNLHGLGGS